jgi:ribose 5-phosphate isomerase B
VVDVGVGSGEDTDYPHVGVAAGQLVAAGEADRALLVCGTGIGVAMAAGTVPGVRASVAHDAYSVERLVKSNNAQVLTLGQRVIGLELARSLVSGWLDHRFDESSASASKVEALVDYQLGGGRPSLTTGAPATTAATFH